MNLFEWIISAAIIAILAGLSLPLGTLYQQQLKAADQHTLVTALHFAKMLAIESGTPSCLTLGSQHSSATETHSRQVTLWGCACQALTDESSMVPTYHWTMHRPISIHGALNSSRIGFKCNGRTINQGRIEWQNTPIITFIHPGFFRVIE